MFNMKKFLSKNFYIFIFLSLLISSCKGIKIENSKDSSVEEFSYGQAMILVAEEKYKYQSRFGKEIWNLRSGDGEQLFKNYVVDNIKKFVENIMAIKMLSEIRDISIDGDDINNINKATDEYQSLLTNEDIDFLKCNRDDIYNMFYDFHLSRLVIDDLTKNSNVELSISESKVIKVQYIVVSDYEKAKELKEKVEVKNANFAYYARNDSEEDTIDMIIKRGDMISIRFPEVFYLSNGMVSNVLTYRDKYYIFKCVNDYLIDETNKRKNEILNTIKNAAFFEYYDNYLEENSVISNASFWKEIDLVKGINSNIYGFYDIYYKYFEVS